METYSNSNNSSNSDNFNVTVQTGWANINENWYYLNSDGSMAANATIDGYKLDESSKLVLL